MKPSQIDLWRLQVQAGGWDNFGLLPKLGHCPLQVIRCLCREFSFQIVREVFSSTVKVLWREQLVAAFSRAPRRYCAGLSGVLEPASTGR